MVNAAADDKQLPSWWKGGVSVYQIYPASFKDDNGDGYGDLRGIINKLDYLKALGIEAIWVSPHYKSPRIDEGYDISDYKDIWDKAGTLEDCQELIDKVNEKGMRIMFDLVVNHTSDQHAWFQESRSSKTNPKRDWYIWRPARYIDGVRHPPCNWRAAFGGSVWEWDELTEEYYLHYFVPEQPDLNWENPEVRQAIYNDAIKFWLDRGVSGFRIDTSNLYSKHLDFPDAPVTDPDTPWQTAWDLMANGPRLREFLQEMNREAFSKYDCFTIGELPHTPSHEKILSYISTDSKALNSTILFDLMDLDHKGGRYPLMRKDYKLSEFKYWTEFSQELADPKLKAHALTYIENHDQARCISRFASDAPEHRLASSKLLATYLLTLSGSIIVYEGQEIGMINCPKDWSIEKEYKDVNTINTLRQIKEDAKTTNDPSLVERGIEGIQLTARDHSRTPMQWGPGKNADFSTNPDAQPWMRVMDSYAEGINVAAQEDDPSSTLNFYRGLFKHRNAHKDVFVQGLFKLHDRDNEKTVIYTKESRDGSRTALVVLNFTAEAQTFDIPSSLSGKKGDLLFSTLDNTADELKAYEARVYIY
ncbi:hypothetical protein JCM10207_000063 [Rhodosporidiobolus poonsookiae]